MAGSQVSGMKDDQQFSRELDWAAAEVHDAELEVGLTGDPSKEWKARLEAVLARLDHPGHPWGRVRLAELQLKVADVVEGHEAELRHFLEAAVQQANADLAPEPSDPDHADPADAGVSDFDQRMTDAFRGAAAPPAES